MSPFIPAPSVRHCDRVLARSVFLILLGLFTATIASRPASLSGEVEYQTTSALARTGRAAIGGTSEAVWLAEHADDPRVPLRAGRGGFQSTEDPGRAIAGIPFHALGRVLRWLLPWIEVRHRETGIERYHRSEYFEHLAVGWRNALLGAALGMAIVLTARRLGASRLAAWLAGLSFGCTTGAWAATRDTQGHVQTAFLLMLGFHVLVRLREEFERLRRPTTLEFTTFGLAAGLAVVTDVAILPAVLVLDVAAVRTVRQGCTRLESWRASAGHERVPGHFSTLAWIALPQLLLLGLWLAANQWRFGDPLAGLEGRFELPASSMLALRMLVAPGGGLLWFAPPVLLVLFGIGAARRARHGHHRWGGIVLGVCLATLLAALIRRPQPGVWTYGPSALLPLLPFLWLGVAFGLERARDRLGLRILAGATLVLGLLVQIPAVLVDHATYRDVALQAAPLAWPDLAGEPSGELDGREGPEGAVPGEDRTEPTVAVEEEVRRRAQWSWQFAAPWVHWRLLRHRVAGLGEGFPVRDVFGVDDDGSVEPRAERNRGFRHLAWVDLVERLGGPAWLPALLVLALLALGAQFSLRGLDRQNA